MCICCRHIITLTALNGRSKMAKKFYYAVQNGRHEGVYDSWNDCKSQIAGYSGAVYKKFSSFGEAQAFSKSSSGYSGSSSGNNGCSSSSSNNSGSSHRNSSSYNGSYGSYNGSSNFITNASSSGAKTSTSSSRNYGSSSYSSSAYLGNSYGRNTYSGGNYGGVSKKSTSSSDSKNYYAVKSNNPKIKSKIFNNWDDCKSYVYKQKGLSYMKFDSEDGAKKYASGTADSATDYSRIKETEEGFKGKYGIQSTVAQKYSQSANVYCDGSSLSNGTRSARAGYGVYFEGEPQNNISERLKGDIQTNNRGEIQAVSSALETIWSNLTTNDEKKVYKIKTDSEYVVKLLNDRYHTYSASKLSTLPNNDLVKPLIENYVKVKKYYDINKDYFGNDNIFQIEWVKGHAGHEGNEIADELARQGAAKEQ